MKNTIELVAFARSKACTYTGGDFWRTNAITMTKSAMAYVLEGDEINAREMAYKALAELCVEDCLKITS